MRIDMRRYHLTINGSAVAVDVRALSAEQFEVICDGVAYDVRLEGDEALDSALISPAMEGPRSAAPALPSAAPRAAPALATPRAAPAPAARPTAGAAGGAAIRAPMPGTIASIDVSVGAQVERGQVLLVLEAMKMNNAIRAPRDGQVAELLVVPGQSVAHGDPLLKLI
jgi:glutaconyl-CoA/methylmalonyl-CoA decarboxylase subunit gamma